MSKAALEAAKAAKEFAKILSAHEISNEGPNNVYRSTDAVETFRDSVGNDTVSYDQSSSDVALFGTNVFFTNSTGRVADTLVNIDNVIGSKFGDTLFGEQTSNILVGLDGDDTIVGGGGNDRLYGDAGKDTLVGGGGGAVYFDGGTGNDVIAFSAVHNGSATIVTGEGTDTVTVSILDNTEFEIVIKDFQPHWERAGSFITPTEAQQGDQLFLRFSDTLGTGDLTARHLHVLDNDLILHFDNANVHGEIIFEDIGDYMDLGNFNISIVGTVFHPAPPPGIN